MQTRTFLYTDVKSNKFWTIALSSDGKSHTVTYGKTGTVGQTLTKDFPSADACRKAADKLIAEKTAKDYVEQTSAASTGSIGSDVSPTPAASPKTKPVKTPATGFTKSDFYGLPVTDRIARACHEHLTSRAFQCDDIATGHIKINFSYFGAIDKTLAGFIILDDEGDDYTLLDARDTAQVYEQEHEEGTFSIDFANLDDYLDYRKTRNAKKSGYAPKKPAKSTRAVPTEKLAERYNWLVHLLANPLPGSTKEDSHWREFAGSAAASFLDTWPDDTDSKAFASEKKHLESDPHLALYWLLHTAIFNWQKELAEVLAITARITGPAAPLLASFTRLFGSLRLDGDIPQVKDFRARRAYLYQYGTPIHSVDLLCIDSENDPVNKAAWIVEGISTKEITPEQIAAALPDLPPKAPTTTLLRAALDISQKKSSKHADDAVRQFAALDLTFDTGLDLAEYLCNYTIDHSNAALLIKVVYSKDNYSPTLIKLMIAAQKSSKKQLFEQSLAYYESVLKIAEKVRPITGEIIDSPKNAVAIAEKVKDPEVRTLLARRIAMRVDIFEAADIQLWASQNKGDQLTRQSFYAFPNFTIRETIVKQLAQTIDGPTHPMAVLMLDILQNPNRPGDPVIDDYQFRNALECAAKVLLPFAHTPEIFEAQMRILEAPGHEEAVSVIAEKTFSRDAKLLDRLDDTQATRVLRAFVATVERTQNPDHYAANRLYYINHPGVLAAATEAMETTAAKHAAAVTAKNKIGMDVYDKIGDNLYSVLANIKAEAVLEKRLYAETHFFWRLGNAIGEIITPAWHKRILTRLAARPEPRAIGLYAYTLAEHAEKTDLQVELLRQIVSLPVPADTTDRAYFKHALLSGVLAAIDQQQYDLVIQAHALAETIKGAPVTIHHTNPAEKFTDKDTAKKLAAILSGKAGKAAAKAKEKVAEAAATGQRLLNLTNAQLEKLGSFKVDHRWFHDTTTGEIIISDTNGNAHYFDGISLSDTLQPVCLDNGKSAKKTSSKQFLADIKSISQRILFTKGKSDYLEAVRYGDRVTLHFHYSEHYGRNPVGIRFASEAQASDFMARFRANPPAGMTESDPWYLEGYGVVRRRYDDYLYVINNAFSESEAKSASHEGAIAEHEAYALKKIRAGRPMDYLYYWDSCLKEHDMTLDVWFYNITNQKPVSYFTDSFRRVHECALKNKLPLKHPFELTIAPPATDAEIAAFAKTYKRPLPTEVIALWKQAASIRWKYGDVAGSILSPAEAAASCEKTKAFVKTRLPKKADKDLLETAESVRAIALDANGDPLLYMSDIKLKESEYAFAYSKEAFDKSYWVTLSWNLGYMVLRPVTDAIAADAPVVGTIYCGQEPNPKAIHRRFEVKEGTSGKFWEIRYDDKARVIGTCYGKIGTAGSSSAKRYADSAEAAKTYEAQVAEKLKKGYKETRT